jgi:hypothetical protein
MKIGQKLSVRILRLAVVGVCTMAFLLVTRPTALPALLLIVPFVGMFSFCYLLALEVIRFLGPDTHEGEEPGNAVVRIRRPRLLAAVAAGFPVLLVVLQSIVELTIWDVLIAFGITLLAYLYVSRSAILFWRR